MVCWYQYDILRVINTRSGYWDISSLRFLVLSILASRFINCFLLSFSLGIVPVCVLGSLFQFFLQTLSAQVRTFCGMRHAYLFHALTGYRLSSLFLIYSIVCWVVVFILPPTSAPPRTSVSSTLHRVQHLNNFSINSSNVAQWHPPRCVALYTAQLVPRRLDLAVRERIGYISPDDSVS